MAGPPHIRCPACGGMTKAPSLMQAGQHLLQVRRVLRGLGRGRGFAWSTELITAPALRFLHEALGRAMAQVETMLASAPEAAPTCTTCGIGLAWEPRTWMWHCTSCDQVWPAQAE